MTNHNAQKSATPSNDEIALIALMRADAAVWSERNDDDADEVEAARREKIRAARIGKKQSAQTIAKKVAGLTEEGRAAIRAARQRQAERNLKLKSQPAVSPAQSKKRTSYG